MVFNVLSFNLDVAWLEEVATISIRWRAYRLCADDATYYLRSASSDAKIGRIMNRLKPNWDCISFENKELQKHENQ